MNNFGMINRALYILLTTAISFISFENREMKLPDIYVQQLSSGDFKNPSIHSFDILFVSTDNNKKARININTLHEIYIQNFTSSFSSFYQFLSAGLNQKIIVPHKMLKNTHAEIFTFDKAIRSGYENGALYSLLKKCCNRRDLDEYSLKQNSWDSGSVNTILYYLFANNFKIQAVDSEESFAIVPMGKKN